MLFASTLTATVPHTFNAEHDLIVTVAVVMSSSCENDFSVPSKIEGLHNMYIHRCGFKNKAEGKKNEGNVKENRGREEMLALRHIHFLHVSTARGSRKEIAEKQVNT